MMRRLIRTDGTSVVLPTAMSMAELKKMMGATAIDTVCLRSPGQPLMVMLVDDDGYETEVVETESGHIELRPTKARKPVNAKATRLYWDNCSRGTTHQIVGDVVIVPDDDFLEDAF